MLLLALKSPRFFAISMVLLSFLSPTPARAEEFAVFDGRAYNGKYYPRIDVIEWGTPSHMEFHVYSKGKPVKMSFQLERKNGKVVMLVDYLLTERNEHVCRRVLAPGHFLDNFMVYTDNSDVDFDNTIVTMDPLPDKKGQTIVKNGTYSGCSVEVADKKSDTDREPAGELGGIAPGRVDHTPTKAKDGAIPTNW